jgi:hypothetical protein
MKHLFSTWKIELSKSLSQAKAYKKEYESYGNVSISLDYLLGAIPVKVYHADKLVGGVVYNGFLPMRYLDVFKDEKDKITLLESEHLRENDLLEMSAIFKCHNTNKWERVLFFVVIFYFAHKLAVRFNKIAILGGSLVKAIQKSQSRLMSHVLFRSPLHTTDKNLKPSNGKIAMIYYAKTNGFFKKAMGVIIVDTWNKLIQQSKK